MVKIRKILFGLVAINLLVGVLIIPLTALMLAAAPQYCLQWTPVMKGGFRKSQNMACCASLVFRGNLYGGTSNFVTGGEIWRSSGGKEWTQLIKGGFGDPNNFVCFPEPVSAFVGYLFVASGNELTGGEIWMGVAP